MGVFEALFVFEAETKDAIHAAVGEENDRGKEQPGCGGEQADGIEEEGSAFVMPDVIENGADGVVDGVAEHAEIGNEEEKGEPPPSVVELTE